MSTTIFHDGLGSSTGTTVIHDLGGVGGTGLSYTPDMGQFGTTIIHTVPGGEGVGVGGGSTRLMHPVTVLPPGSGSTIIRTGWSPSQTPKAQVGPSAPVLKLAEMGDEGANRAETGEGSDGVDVSAKEGGGGDQVAASADDAPGGGGGGGGGGVDVDGVGGGDEDEERRVEVGLIEGSRGVDGERGQGEGKGGLGEQEEGKGKGEGEREGEEEEEGEELLMPHCSPVKQTSSTLSTLSTPLTPVSVTNVAEGQSVEETHHQMAAEQGGAARLDGGVGRGVRFRQVSSEVLSLDLAVSMDMCNWDAIP